MPSQVLPTKNERPTAQDSDASIEQLGLQAESSARRLAVHAGHSPDNALQKPIHNSAQPISRTLELDDDDDRDEDDEMEIDSFEKPLRR